MFKSLVISEASLKASAKKFNYSPSVSVGGLVFVSGLIGRGVDGHVPPSINEQVSIVMGTLAEILAAADLTLHDLVSVTTYHADVSEIGEFAEARAPYLNLDAPPAWTAVGVAALGHPEAKFELKAIAAR